MKRACLTVLATTLLLMQLSGCASHVHAYAQTVIPPSCKTIGYTIHSCVCGESYYSDYQAVSAHTFGTWQTGVSATLTSGGEEYRICEDCGVLEARDVENLSTLPKLYVTADGSFLYSAGEMMFSCLCTIQSRTVGIKRAYDLHLQSNTGDPYAVDLGWGMQASYALEPCVPDASLTRAKVAESIWSAIKEQRSDAEWFPAVYTGSMYVQLYIGGEYLGIYLLTPPESGWKYSYNGYHGSPTAALIANGVTDGSRFSAKPTYGTDGDFLITACSTADSSWAIESFDGFCTFVRDAKNSAFREQLSQYTDPQVLIDYFLLTCFFGQSSGETAETVWATADGIHWLPSFSFADLNTSFGITAKGALYKGDKGIPKPAPVGYVAYNGNNLLWTRLCNLFASEIIERYAALREEILDATMLAEQFEASRTQVEQGLFVAEHALYPSVPIAGSDSEQLLAFLEQRIAAMDAWLFY